MKKEVLRLVNVTAGNRQYEKMFRINLLIREGETVLLWDRDGSGRMLVRFLGGEGTLREGSVHAGGRRLRGCSKAALEEHKIFYMDADAAFMNSLDLAENLFLLRRNSLRKFRINERALHAQAKELFARYGLSLDGSERPRSLSAGDRMAVSLVKAAAQGAGLIVLNNILRECSAGEVKLLCGVIGRMKAEGVSFLICEVRTQELLAQADSMLIMARGAIVKKLSEQEQFARRGEIAAKSNRSDDSKSDDNRRGGSGKTKRAADQETQQGYTIRKEKADGQPAIRVSPGEILLLAHDNMEEQTLFWNALMGKTEQKLIIELDTGALRCDGCERLVQNRIALWGSKAEGGELFYRLSAQDNVLLPSLKRISRFGFYRKKAQFIRRDELSGMEELLRRDVASLSDRQLLQMTLCRWKLFHPKILVVNQILSALDEEQKSWLSGQLCEMAKRKSAVILLETAVDDAMKIADRMLAVKNHEICGEWTRREYAGPEGEDF